MKLYEKPRIRVGYDLMQMCKVKNWMQIISKTYKYNGKYAIGRKYNDYSYYNLFMRADEDFFLILKRFNDSEMINGERTWTRSHSMRRPIVYIRNVKRKRARGRSVIIPTVYPCYKVKRLKYKLGSL